MTVTPGVLDGLTLVSADCHVTEPLDLWERELPPALRERGPRIEMRDGRTCLLVEGRVARKLPPFEVPAHDEGERPRFWTGDARDTRIEALDRDGVWAEVMYPNLAFFCAFEIEDPALQDATCRVYNDWVADEFGQHPRLAPVALLPVRDPAAAVRELERARAAGLRGAMLPTYADYRPYNDSLYEPLWEAAADLQVPLSFHAGTGRGQVHLHGDGAAVVNYVVTVSGPMETAATLCASGVLERHPQLRVGMIECGAGWLAWTLDAMDDAYREHHAWVRPKLEALPSESFRRQGFVTFQRDPVGIANAAYTGARCLLWGSDYPHPEGTYPESRRVLAEQLAGVPPELARRIVRDNAVELYGFALPDDA